MTNPDSVIYVNFCPQTKGGDAEFYRQINSIQKFYAFNSELPENVDEENVLLPVGSLKSHMMPSAQHDALEASQTFLKLLI